MKIFLAGEGRDELGFWFDRPDQYRDEKNSPGLIEALLTALEIEFLVEEGRQWKQILKYEAGDHRTKEMKNVLGAVQEALDRECEALVFVRDVDSVPSREHEIKEAIDDAKKKFPELLVCGGVAIRKIEAWILALHGERDSERHAKPEDILSEKYGIAKRAQKVAAVTKAALERIPNDAKSLLDWIEATTALKL